MVSKLLFLASLDIWFSKDSSNDFVGKKPQKLPQKPTLFWKIQICEEMKKITIPHSNSMLNLLFLLNLLAKLGITSTIFKGFSKSQMSL